MPPNFLLVFVQLVTKRYFSVNDYDHVMWNLIIGGWMGRLGLQNLQINSINGVPIVRIVKSNNFRIRNQTKNLLWCTNVTNAFGSFIHLRVFKYWYLFKHQSFRFVHYDFTLYSYCLYYVSIISLQLSCNQFYY